MPEIPLATITMFDKLDSTADYFPWKCNDYAELQTTDNGDVKTDTGDNGTNIVIDI